MTVSPDLVGYPAHAHRGVLDLGQRHFAWPNGEMILWWHDCPAAAHVSWGWIGCRSDGIRSGHVIESVDPITVGGSLICTECQDHGWIRDGAWVKA